MKVVSVGALVVCGWCVAQIVHPAAAAAAGLDEYGVGVPRRPAEQLYEASCDVDIDLRGALVRVEVRQRIANPGTTALAAVLELPLPDGAAITGFALDGESAIAIDPARAPQLVDDEGVLGADPALLDLTHDGYRVVLQPVAGDHIVTLTTRYSLVAAITGGAARLTLPGRGVASKLTACRVSLHATAGPGVTVREVRAGSVATTGARAIFTVVPVSATGFSIYTQGGAHVVVDIVGYFTGPSATLSSVGLFAPQVPTRLLDTRTGPAGFVWPGGTIELPATATGHAAAWLNYTSTDAFAAGFMTAWPARTLRPITSSLNAPAAGVAIANAAITNLSSAGIALSSFAGENLIADLAGYFTGAPYVATTPAVANQPPATFTFGSSADGRVLTSTHRQGSDSPTRNVLVIGSMHGEEPAGIRVVNALATTVLPPDLELWPLRTMNPDGLATGTRRNGNDVDLNRNWPGSLYPSVVTSGSGPYPMSEPENQGMQRLVNAIESRHPLDWAVSYHQPLFTVDCDPARGQPLLSACSAFSKTTGTPMQTFLRIPGTMTDTMNGLGKGHWFTVEFGGTQPSEAEVSRHVTAISLIDP